MSLTGWRGQLVALGFDQDQVQYGTLPIEWVGTFPEPSDDWRKLLHALALREAAKDTEAGHIIAALLDIIREERENTANASQNVRQENDARLTAQRQLAKAQAERDDALLDVETLKAKLGNLKEISRTTENAALVGHQVGAFIDAGRKIIKVSELDLPPEWQGPCDRGPCAANDGHDGTCAEASGWAAGDR